MDDKKDEDVVAVLLDEPAPEGQCTLALSVTLKTSCLLQQPSIIYFYGQPISLLSFISKGFYSCNTETLPGAINLKSGVKVCVKCFIFTSYSFLLS